MKLFYDHLILIEDVFVENDRLDLSNAEKKQAKQMSDEYMHHQVLIYILDSLPKQCHQDFLHRLHKSPYDVRHLSFLQDKTQRDIHADLVALGKKIKAELLDEIKKHSK